MKAISTSLNISLVVMLGIIACGKSGSNQSGIKDKAIARLIRGKRIRITMLLKEVITSPVSSIVVWTELSALPVTSIAIGKKMSTWTMTTPHME